MPDKFKIQNSVALNYEFIHDLFNYFTLRKIFYFFIFYFFNFFNILFQLLKNSASPKTTFLSKKVIIFL